METNTTASTASDRACAEYFLASAFADIMSTQPGDLERMEEACIEIDHAPPPQPKESSAPPLTAPRLEYPVIMGSSLVFAACPLVSSPCS